MRRTGWALLGLLTACSGAGEDLVPQGDPVEREPAERDLADPPPGPVNNPARSEGAQTIEDRAQAGATGTAELGTALAAQRAAAQERAGEDLGALAQFEAVDAGRTGGGVVLCAGLPGQEDAPLELSLAQEPGVPGASPGWVRGQSMGDRIMLIVPKGTGSAEARYASGLTQQVAWSELEAGTVQECSRP